MLLMKRIYFDAIRAGSKTTTLRYWRTPRVRAGQSYRIPGLGKIVVKLIAPVTLKSLTAADAQADGFASMAALRHALRMLYTPIQRKSRQLYQIRLNSTASALSHSRGGGLLRPPPLN